ncbi:hypothetical protein [Legionella waltersii]|uniref:Uncharacterized protein n=1 Tax=Legionella waltersii TaxID=66969 RepID=A0A0W1AGS4_9GAMM|nr:hypothetical protein [Legionella waltersii]KTD80534.1 hypothetical protein Lwal_1233 [Legionella waltersii]SNV09390.1 Uncharacterised protein [Legionella waltersii]
MKLSLDGTYEQTYNIAYKGTVYDKESFLCVKINDKHFKSDPLKDEFTQFQSRLMDKIIPALSKIIAQKLGKNAFRTQYVIHDVGGEQGQDHPHLILRRDDFNVLSPKDRLNITNLIMSAIEQINQKSLKQVQFDLSNSFFSTIDNKTQDPIKQTNKTSPSFTN